MSESSNFMLNISVIYRNIQKYYDRILSKYDIGSGQLMCLLAINESEGSTMQEITNLVELDKGTITKSIAKLEKQNYVITVVDEKDHRIHRLYCTKDATKIIPEIYELRKHCRDVIAKDIDFDEFEKMLLKAAYNSRIGLNDEQEISGIKIGGLQKVTLLDYPNKIAATIFMSGCTFKCPYCHNRELVFIPEQYEFVETVDVFEYLKKRKNILDAVCISGGEPLMQKDLVPLLEKIKEIGYAIKLDTNGYYPNELKKLVDLKLVDYVAMDIKNIPEKYANTLGIKEDTFNYKPIKETISYLLNDNVDYEFRTTIVKEFHDYDDIVSIAKKIKNAKRYYLQQYIDSPNCIQHGFSSYDKKEMEEILTQVKKYIPNAELRGVKED